MVDTSLFERTTRLENLEKAWLKARENDGAAGGDGMTLKMYEEGLSIRLMRLQRDLRNGTYVPGPVREVQLPKKDGGIRPLAIPCIGDRVVQTAAAMILGPLLEAEMEDSSYGYRSGRSVRMAVTRISQHRRNGYTWVVDGDIERYFENVPHALLLERLSRSVSDPLLLDLIGLWLDCGGFDGVGLPQGAPISPLLSNLYLDQIDEEIEGRGIRLVRFADDFVLLCKSKFAAHEALKKMSALLEKYGLKLNPDKTRVVPFE